jgi:molybdopterin-synthase adenylyltransferase
VLIGLKSCSWQRAGETLTVVHDPSRKIELADPDGDVEVLLATLADGSWTLPALRERLAESGVEVDLPQLQEVVGALDSLRLLANVDGAAGWPDRYASNLAFFDLFGTLAAPPGRLQRRLRQAHVLQLGTGGLGSNVLQSLAGLGVGRLTLLDDDLVEPRNFARQFLYRERDIGTSKVDQAARWVREYDSTIEVRPVRRRVRGPADLADLLAGVDLVVAGIDQPDDVDMWVNEACVRAGVPWVRGGMFGSELIYFSVDPGRTGCWACRRTAVERDAAGEAAVGVRLSEGRGRINAGIGPAAALVGSLVAFEALRYLTGYQPPVAAGATVHVSLSGDHPERSEPWPRDPDCPVCAAVPAAVPAP